jgi:insulysin
MSNAYTGHEETNYFSVAKDKLEQALDIFAQFFISPLFTRAALSAKCTQSNSENTKT